MQFQPGTTTCSVWTRASSTIIASKPRGWEGFRGSELHCSFLTPAWPATKVKVHSSEKLPASFCFTLPNRSCTDPPCPQEVWPLLPLRLLSEPRGCSLSLSLLCSSPACRPRVPRLPWMAVTGPTEVTSGSQPQTAMAATDDVIHFYAEIPRPARDLLTSSKYSVTSMWWWVE